MGGGPPETTDTVPRRGRGLDAGLLTRRPSSGLRLMSRLHEQLSHASDHPRCHICGNRTAPATDDGTHGDHSRCHVGSQWGVCDLRCDPRATRTNCGAPHRKGCVGASDRDCSLQRLVSGDGAARRIGWHSREVRSMKTCMRWKSAVRSALSPDRPYSMAAPSFHPTTNESRSVPAAPARQPTSGLPTQTAHIRNSSRADRDGGNARRPGLVMEARWRSTREAEPANPDLFDRRGAARAAATNERPRRSEDAELVSKRRMDLLFVGSRTRPRYLACSAHWRSARASHDNR